MLVSPWPEAASPPTATAAFLIFERPLRDPFGPGAEGSASGQMAATRSLSSPSRICWSSVRSRCPSDLAWVGRRSSIAAAIVASIRASTASVLASRPSERAKERTWKGLIACSGSPAFRRVSSRSRWKGPEGSYAIRSTPESIQAISFRKPASSFENRDASHTRLDERSHDQRACP